MKAKKSDTKKVFLKKGTCSRTLFYILNREFGNLKEEEEQASDPLAGGIAQEGYQCGMLWGAALAVGAESFRRYENHGEAIAHAISATQYILESFINRAKSANCGVITNCDFNGKFGLAKFLITGKPLICFNLADKWAPEAIQSANAGLSQQPTDSPELPVSCASEVVKKMGGSNEEMVMVAGFAGGFGLSGNACGALSAAIWMNTLARVRQQNYKHSLSDPGLNKIMTTFFEETSYKMECWKICGQHFKTINDHTEFIKNGGCQKLINVLAKS
ncbi:MAG: C-GCAxxG-C-C family (seleno)protein [Melioribacteraceae bacterium]